MAERNCIICIAIMESMFLHHSRWSFLPFVVFLVVFSALRLNINSLHISKIITPAFQTQLNSIEKEPTTSRNTYNELIGLVKPYSDLSVVEPELSFPTYLQSSSLSDIERRTIKYFFDDYIEFHIKHRFKSNRYFLFSPTPAGLGDRSFWLVRAYWVAVLSRRILLIDKISASALLSLLSPVSKDFNLIYNESIDISRRVTGINHQHSNSTAYLKANWNPPVEDEFLLLSNVRTVVCKCNTTLSMSREFIERTRPENISVQIIDRIGKSHIFARILYNHVLRIRDDVRARYLSEMDNLDLLRRGDGNDGERTKSFVAVHARIGEGLGEVKGRFQDASSNKAKFATCLARRAISIIRRWQLDNVIYLATDTPGFTKIFNATVLQMGYGQSFYNVRSSDWRALHSARGYRGNDTQLSLNRSSVDLAILGHSKHIVALYSSFPRLALWIGKTHSLTEITNSVCLEELSGQSSTNATEVFPI